MSANAWFLGLRIINKDKASNTINEALKTIGDIHEELSHIETSILSGALEHSFVRLYKLLISLGNSGIPEALAYSSRAHLLAEYSRALRVRVERLGSRGLSDARDEMLRNLDDIESFIRDLQKLLQTA